jgi:hypothetical protein
VWFSEFAERAAGHGLSYVGEADLKDTLPGGVPDAVEAEMRELAGGDRIVYEQLSDILRCMFFRQSVVCRDSRTPVAGPFADALRDLHFAARGDVAEDPAPGSLLSSAVALLRSRAPDTIEFSELRAALSAEPDALAEAMLEAFNTERVMLHRAPLVSCRPAEVERPVASRLARWQAAHGTEITSRAYTTVIMEEPAARTLITLLDGTRDRAAVRAEFDAITGVRLSAEDLEVNLGQLARIFVLEP